ncbi:DUF3253 domain-containing protein [Ancylobacter terrae]|uniref:DUF3253 domain-containing protein n=1 Tax=Ancylobacter sp. sgz301288 TaxID=3342077 RepID=UPI00385D4006
MSSSLPMSTAADLPSDDAVAAMILDLAARRQREAGAGKSIDPSEPARALAGETQWQRLLPIVRRAAVTLAREGRLVIYRKGKPVDPDDFRGVYRLGLPAAGGGDVESI